MNFFIIKKYLYWFILLTFLFLFNQKKLFSKCLDTSCNQNKNNLKISRKKNKRINEYFEISRKKNLFVFSNYDIFAFETLLSNIFLVSNAENTNLDDSRKSFDIESDIQYIEGDIYYAEGNVIINLSNGFIKADKISYDRKNKILEANNNIILEKGNQYINAKFLKFNFLEKSGMVNEVYGVIDSKSINIDFDLLNKKEINDYCLRDNSDLINSPSETSLLGSNNIRLKNKLGFDSFKIDFQNIDKWRFKTKKLILEKDRIKSDLVYFTNDPFNKPQLLLKSQNFSIDLDNENTSLISKKTSINFDQKFSLPLGKRTIGSSKSVDAKWGVGYQVKDKDGLFISRTFNPYFINDDLLLEFKSYFLLQRAILGESNSFRKKHSAIYSDNKKTDIEFLDYFAFKTNLFGKLKKWDLNLLLNQKTLNNYRFYDSFSYDLNLKRNLFLRENMESNNCVNNNIFDENKEKLKIDFGIFSAFEKDNIYFANGFKLITDYKFKKDDFFDKLNLSLDFGNFQGESNLDKNKLLNLNRYGLITKFENTFRIFSDKYNNENINEEYLYSSVVINQGISLKSEIAYGIYQYSNDESQSLASIAVGPQIVIGSLKGKWFDYTSLSVIPEYAKKNGKSPFKFDDFNDSSRIRLSMKQQLYGPFIFNFSSYYNVNNNSNNYGKFENNKFSFGISRRAYKINLIYEELPKLFAIQFEIFNFGYRNSASKF